jgi:uncharacterized coiled-coil protein SlyX
MARTAEAIKEQIRLNLLAQEIEVLTNTLAQREAECEELREKVAELEKKLEPVQQMNGAILEATDD